MPAIVDTGPTARAGASRRPPEARALAALFVGAAACLGISVLLPMNDQAPTDTAEVMIVLALVLAALTFTLAHRLPRWVMLAQAVGASVLNSILVALAETPVGAVADAFAYTWLIAYVAVFFPAATMAFAVLVAVGFGGGLSASGLPNLEAAWAIATITSLMLGAVLSGISRRVRGHIGTDTLTGALNRSGLSAAADRALLVSRRQADEIAVAALDLDDFKQVNDRDGHLAGDRLLADAVAAWRGELRSDDVLARTGGDEFVLVMPGTSVDQAGALIERLRRAHAIEFSAGVARWDRDESFEACLERADRGLYGDKARRQRPPLRLPRPPP